ncbi:MAG: BON domain-containing protein [Acidobacteriaceae bacterium]
MISKRTAIAALLSLVLALPIATSAQSSAPANQKDAKIQQEVDKRIQKSKDLKNVSATVNNGEVTLNGSVDRLYNKLNLDRKVSGMDGVEGVRNHITVSSSASDAQLGKTIADKLRYDRAGYGLVWNAISLKVQNGIVTLSGLVREPVDKDSAMAIVENTPGVKGIDDDLEVAPNSPFDDQIRVAVARAIYGYGPLQRYALDPQKPIRIAVANGHVALYGVVDSKMDSQLAEMRAKSVPNVFSVENHLYVANGSNQAK